MVDDDGQHDEVTLLTFKTMTFDGRSANDPSFQLDAFVVVEINELKFRPVLTVALKGDDFFGVNAKSFGPCSEFSSRGFGVVRIFIVSIILADIDHRQLP